MPRHWKRSARARTKLIAETGSGREAWSYLALYKTTKDESLRVYWQKSGADYPETTLRCVGKDGWFIFKLVPKARYFQLREAEEPYLLLEAIRMEYACVKLNSRGQPAMTFDEMWGAPGFEKWVDRWFGLDPEDQYHGSF